MDKQRIDNPILVWLGWILTSTAIIITCTAIIVTIQYVERH